jgi:hypothetical protein
LIRGKFSGQILMVNNQLSMDYSQLMTLGNNEKEKAMTMLKERLERMSPYETMKKQAELVESMKNALSGVPLRMMVR